MREQLSLDQWQTLMKSAWHQGEHVAIIGPTGTGKTTITQRLLECREYVVILAVKKYDETINRFTHGAEVGLSRYKVISKWPPDYPQRKVILWVKPKDIGSKDEQAQKLYGALNAIYQTGGWTICFDDGGYITGTLGLGRALVVLLSQGRSSNISVVVCMTRPSSMISHVPKEALNQCRHILIFKYKDEREVKTCAEIAGVSAKEMLKLVEELRYDERKSFSDFVYAGKGHLAIVKNVSRET